MALFWVNAIAYNDSGKPGLISWYDGCLKLEQAMDGVRWLKENYKVLSAWIDRTDDNGKSTVFHECYVDAFGYVRY